MGDIMTETIKNKIATYLRLLTLHRGEAKEAYDKVASIYDDFAKVWDHAIAAPALAYYNQIIEERVKPGALVLEAAAGTGERTLALLRHSPPGRIFALDASTAMLDLARSKVQDPRVRFMKGDINELPFEDNTFDVVSCTWAVEIMDDPRSTVEEFVRVIKPDGFVVYAFCSLPAGKVGEVLKYAIAKTPPVDNPLSHLLSETELPFHCCAYSSLKQFLGGLITVATVAKCCPIRDPSLPCRRQEIV